MPREYSLKLLLSCFSSLMAARDKHAPVALLQFVRAATGCVWQKYHTHVLGYRCVRPSSADYGENLRGSTHWPPIPKNCRDPRQPNFTPQSRNAPRAEAFRRSRCFLASVLRPLVIPEASLSCVGTPLFITASFVRQSRI
jgi:hypothetical protein